MAAVPSHDVDDEELARRARSGDPCAFEDLMTRYSSRVYRLGLRLTGNRSDAEEVLQETFLRVFRRLGSFRGDSLFATWLYRVAANNALMLVRARKRRRTEPLDRYMPLFDGSGRHRRDADHARAAKADEILDRRRLAQAALGALQRLPPIHRTAFVLRDLQELSTAQVAEVLGVTPATVRQRVHRARLSMRGYLSHLVGVEP